MNNNTPAFTAIFDMDGTIIDNTSYHYKAWQELFKKHQLPHLTKQTYLNQISGVPIINTVRQFFGKNADEQFSQQLAEEKQALYRKDYGPHVKPIEGLENFLAGLKAAGIKIALATSSGKEDIDFIFNSVAIGKYFDTLVTGNMVTEPKPSPQIFLKAASLLNANPGQCLVFEDSIAGLKAGKNAGMKVAGITTSHSTAEIAGLANIVFNNYTELHISRLNTLFEDTIK
ncbi:MULTISPECIES: HAD family hydrolase [unclassified Mucilaginibacter]|uniref:HAD family hydrolase n=1 Tax=unclassified Mucilaginibacter TaxID=2617802 RepID=UPI000CB668B2|nr:MULTISPECIES: HAD family phosphatase [unclassified Mucilaginibacter]PLW89519.1 MAG: haloacid dehalogenase [Mucilaginibacter sp.]